MKFLPFLDLRLTDTYYADGRCPDFWIEPTGETQKLLKNYRGVLKPTPNGMRIFMPVTEQNVPFIPLPKETTFAFQLRLHNPDFALFTELTELIPVAAPIYTNATLSSGQSGQLALVARQVWSTERFIIRQPAQEDRFVLQGRPLTGLQLTDFKVEGGVLNSVTRDDEGTKIITIDSKAAKQGDAFSIRYPITPQRASGVFADVEIHYDDSFPAIVEGPKAFQIAFKAKQARWKYYIITDKTNAQFRIEDKNAASLMFSVKNRTDLKQQPDAADNMAIMLAAQYPDTQQWRFVSDDLIPCQQAARKSIQLFLDDHQVVGA